MSSSLTEKTVRAGAGSAGFGSGATVGASEEARLEALRSFSILDTLPEQGYEDVTQLASFICGTPISLVSFVDDERQWFKAELGLGAKQTPRSQSFCANTIDTRGMLVVEDAQNDARFRDNPLVLGDPNIRFYAGAPIVRDGHVLGTVCVIDTVPRTLSATQLSALEALARQASTLLDQRKALMDAEREGKRLAQAARRLTLAQAAGRVATWEWNLATGALLWGEESMWAYGRPAEEISNLDEVMKFLHPEDLPQVMERLQPAIAGTGEYSAEFRIFWPDGSIHWSQAFGKPVLSAEGKPVAIVGFNIDISDRKNADAALIRTEKLAAVGRLASTMAHEINNPLESVMNLIYLARHATDLGQAVPYLETADAELRRASAITNRALRFHKQATRPTSVTFAQLADGLLAGRHSRLRNAHAHLEERNRASRLVLCFEGEVRQVLSNLIGNALDALQGKGGTLFLRARDGHHSRTGKAGMLITVADTGCGMSETTCAKLFDAFFTTKGIGGTGLGLWISKEIMDRHAGSILFRSSQDAARSGSVFTLFLPYDAVTRSGKEG